MEVKSKVAVAKASSCIVCVETIVYILDTPVEAQYTNGCMEVYNNVKGLVESLYSWAKEGVSAEALVNITSSITDSTTLLTHVL